MNPNDEAGRMTDDELASEFRASLGVVAFSFGESAGLKWAAEKATPEQLAALELAVRASGAADRTGDAADYLRACRDRAQPVWDSLREDIPGFWPMAYPEPDHEDEDEPHWFIEEFNQGADFAIAFIQAALRAVGQ
jgi:hypothetical protein